MKKVLSLLLISAMLAATVSCENNPANEETSENNDPTPDTSEVIVEEETEIPQRQLEVKDFGGHTLTVITRDDGGSGSWNTLDLVAEEEVGEAINDSVFRRNTKICELYNISIERIPADPSSHSSMVSNTITAGDDAYDLVLSMLQMQAGMSASGLLNNFKDCNSIDITYKCWDHFGNSFTEIAGKSYYLMGDINLTDNDATYATLFNKVIYSEYPELPDLYELVKTGKWTLDKLNEIAKAVRIDVNGNGTMEWDIDRWGVLDQYEVGTALLCGTGVPMIGLDEDGMLIYNLSDEKIVNSFEKIFNHFADREAHLIADHSDYSGVNDLWNVLARGSFKADRALFFNGHIGNVRLIRDMESDFGILPLPKLDEEQEQYYSMLQSGNATAYSMPTSASDPERTALLLDAICEESTYTLLPAYYETTLKRKSSRDEESSAMLDLIFANRIVSLSNTFTDLGVDSFIVSTLKSANNTFASGEVAKRKATTKMLERLNEQFAGQ